MENNEILSRLREIWESLDKEGKDKQIAFLIGWIHNLILRDDKEEINEICATIFELVKDKEESYLEINKEVEDFLKGL